MNPLSDRLQTGTIGELLVQLRLLQFDVQAVATHKDTGNDLIAVKGDVFRAIQVKTTRRIADEQAVECRRRLLFLRAFHILAFVRLFGEDRNVELDNCGIYLLKREEVTRDRFEVAELEPFKLTAGRIDALFS